MRAHFYGPDGTWGPAALEWNVAEQAPCPTAEFVDAFGYPATFTEVATAVRVPAQYVIAEFEASFVGGAEVLARSAAASGAVPESKRSSSPTRGHNISLHHVAGAYHPRVLAFAEECLVPAAVRRAG